MNKRASNRLLNTILSAIGQCAIQARDTSSAVAAEHAAHAARDLAVAHAILTGHEPTAWPAGWDDEGGEEQ